ncbi:putative disease resistance protein [Prunus yedoensis var. nudiflora]|uniref:Putative disease resistance protein n=1 Tax=Prunus yedoensis var. nudiflora TaxID=2094558 RepID=A0A314YC46_PRUYE|nr:putative disease resistance protein [Prunus yedoensis var. nudiflora]
MAEFEVSTVVEKLTNWIIEDAHLLEGVGDKVEQLRDELWWMQSFLMDADAKQEKNERLRNWVSQIREVALDAEDVFSEVNGCNMDDLKKLEEGVLVLKLHQLLKEMRYLVVLDDIWETDVWDSFQSAFPSGKMGSKVMLTTRNKEVAVYADPMSEPLELRFLTQDERLELFHKKALPGTDMPCDLEKIGREMMAKCYGLQLAVVVLGGLLSTKRKTAEEWRRMLQNITWRLIDQDHVSAILALSYNDLPFHLKSCFLHLGLFPENSSISKIKLKHLWVVEQFLPQQGEEPAEVGTKLHHQHHNATKLGGLQSMGPRWCSLSISSTKCSGKPNSTELKNLRHLLLHGTNPMNLRFDTLSILRTLKCSDGSWIEEGGLACMTNLQQLKIVELTRANLDLVVSNLERLHCLQYLSLEFRGGQPTPIGLSHFEHLHKLHLAGRINKLPELPQNVVKLSLLYSDLEEDSIGKLEMLPNLKFLFLGEGSYNRRKLVYSSEVGFPQLHILRLQLLDDLEELIVEGQ